MNLGAMVDEIADLKSQVDSVDAQLKALEERLESKKHELMMAMQEAGVDALNSVRGRVRVTTSLYPDIQDYDELAAWIKENDAFYFLRRQVNVGPYRELRQSGENLPGVADRHVSKLDFRFA